MDAACRAVYDTLVEKRIPKEDAKNAAISCVSF